MDKADAVTIADERLRELRTVPWDELRLRFVDGSELTEVRRRGVTYQVKTYAHWDDRREGDLRVCVAVDDGGFRAFMPVVRDFIVRRDGTFVDE